MAAVVPETPESAASSLATASGLPATGTIRFTAAKITKSHAGSFADHTSTLRLDGETLAGVAAEVRVASVATDSPKLDKHLRGPDFFDTDTFPTATFQSAEIRVGAPADATMAGATHTVSGDLSLHGVTRRLNLPAVVSVTPTTVTASTEFTINRQDFGVAYPGKPDDLIRDDVVLAIHLTASR